MNALPFLPLRMEALLCRHSFGKLRTDGTSWYERYTLLQSPLQYIVNIFAQYALVKVPTQLTHDV